MGAELACPLSPDWLCRESRLHSTQGAVGLPALPGFPPSAGSEDTTFVGSQQQSVLGDLNPRERGHEARIPHS